jgi:hypothetical protein
MRRRALKTGLVDPSHKASSSSIKKPSYPENCIGKSDVHLAHLVLALATDSTALVVGRGLVLKGDVEVAVVVLVRGAGKHALDLLAGLDGEDVLEVEDGLLPVCVLGVGTGGELDGLVAGGELDVEPRDHGVDVVGAAHGEREGQLEGEVRDGAGVKVDGNDSGGVGDDGLELDGVDEGLGEGGVLQRAVVEAPDVVPDWKKRLAWLSKFERRAGETYSRSCPPCSRRPRYRP